MTVTLDQSYEQCRHLNHRHGTTYYWSARILPEAKRRHVHALYAMCRYADDIVDSVQSGIADKTAALADYGDRLRHGLASGDSAHRIIKAVVHTFTTFKISPTCADRFLASMAMDLTRSSYETFADLLIYMDGSAAVIGEMMLPILEPASPEAFRPARDLGFAFQLTNFLRDVNEDLDRGRVYLPQSELRAYGALEALERRQVTPELAEFMAFQVARTREFYLSADTGISLLPATSARCIRAARILYSGILERIEIRQYDVFSARARVPTWKKLAAARCLLAGVR